MKLRWEDLVPALAGAIGKTSLAAAFALAWATALGIRDADFVTENVRLELVVASVATLVFTVLLNPAAGPTGTLAPLIPIVPLMAAAGVHPLPFAVLVSAAGFLLARKGCFQEIVDVNGPGTKAGILLLFGILGITGALRSLQAWTADHAPGGLSFALLLSGAIAYLLLIRLNARWLVIPASALIALIVSFLFGTFPSFQTGVGLPIFDPAQWWNHRWGIGFGMTARNFAAAIPYALLVLTMWPIDALAVKTFQERNHPSAASPDLLDMKATFTAVTVRNLVGALLGGAQTSAVWRSFLIPLAVLRRPVVGSALLLGLLGIAFAVLGFPIDAAVFPPLVWSVLILGVFAPMLEIGLASLREAASPHAAVVCIVLGIGISPVIGWSVALLMENLNLADRTSEGRSRSRREKGITVVLSLVSIATYAMVAVF